MGGFNKIAPLETELAAASSKRTGAFSSICSHGKLRPVAASFEAFGEKADRAEDSVRIGQNPNNALGYKQIREPSNKTEEGFLVIYWHKIWVDLFKSWLPACRTKKRALFVRPRYNPYGS